MANESGETAKLLDFGLAKFLSTARQDLTAGTAPGAVLGTLRYMSPQQWRGEEAHSSWDLWALAVVAYEMLAGAYPFAATLRRIGLETGMARGLLPWPPICRKHLGPVRSSLSARLPKTQLNAPQAARTFLSELQSALSQPPSRE